MPHRNKGTHMCTSILHINNKQVLLDIAHSN
jgi:hypothetical protein